MIVAPRATVLAAAFLLGACVLGGGGGGVEGEGFTVRGRVAAPDGRPAAAARITVRPAGYLAGLPLDSTGRGGRLAVDTVAGSDGAFRVPGLADGDYVIEILAGSGPDSVFGSLVRVYGARKGGETDLGLRALRPAASLDGKVSRERLADSVALEVRLYGLERRQLCQGDGSFGFRGLAPGSYDLRASSSRPGDGESELRSIAVTPGGRVSVGDVNLPVEYREDSAAVRAVLDAAGLGGRDWTSTVRTVDGRIRELDLSDAGLASLPPALFGLGFLRSLILDGNRLVTLPDGLAGMRGLTGLSLNRVPLGALPPVVPRLDGLEYLYLGNTGITSLPDSFARLDGLIDLSLAGNPMDSLPPAVFKLPRLQVLKVDDDSLRILSPAIGYLGELTHLHLDGNRLAALPATIGRLSKLQVLFLYSNRLARLPDSIGNLQALELLHLENNALTSLPPALGSLARLTYLDFGYNQLASLPGEITRLRPTDRLEAGSNRLCAVPDSVDAWLRAYAGPDWRAGQTCP